ncbi:AcrB/AcrD/AcrF family protein [Maritimibacter sp. DP07]|uniref:AcrB/AcrD/AcrF family protein n=1 Tax=Maritimibacter harenae TaxID=2606218 RepID=A0A845M1E5_9RHOB|nr:efflux RND transporter permease subunit [Maritimibacter harenae]MZR12992.1 AcrB/AcrD/AcrF family protein [Maritimibacter harenae]
MNRVVDWAAARARMVAAFITLSLVAGIAAYVGLPKEGEPDIEIPALFVSVPFPGISAEDSENLLVRPMEQELADIDGLKKMTGTAAENYAGLALEFEFGWDRTKVIADVRDAMNAAEAKFPEGYEKYSVNEINFSEFPIVVVNFTGDVPERTRVRLAREMQDEIEALEPVLEAQLTGARDEMMEVLIDPLKLEAYNVTAGELIQVVTNNNQLIAAGQITTPSGATSIKIPSSFNDVQDIYALPVKVNGDRVVTLGDLAEIRLAFEDRAGTARFNGDTTVSLQVVKRKGFNLIDTVAEVKETARAVQAEWPDELKQAVQLEFSNDQSHVVDSMVRQLEGSVITAIALVMIVVLAALGMRSALLVGFAIPTSFLLTFALFAVLGVAINNIVMFGLILAVGMLVDGAIVVVEYADKRISEGVGPMSAYTEAAKRMFWPIISSTATTLCAFLPMLFWPGIPGEFMGMLPRTLIYVLTASLLVALIYLPVMGGVAGRLSRSLDRAAQTLRPWPWVLRAVLLLAALALLLGAAMQIANPDYLFDRAGLGPNPLDGPVAMIPGVVVFLVMAMITTILMDAVKPQRKPKKVQVTYRRTGFGVIIHAIVGNPVMPIVTIAAVIALVAGIGMDYSQNNRGVEFFADTAPEQAIVYVRGRGNLSIEEKDDMVRRIEDVVMSVPGVKNAFSFAGDGGLNQNTGGAAGPRDTIGQVQIEIATFEERPAYEVEDRLLGIIPYTRTVRDDSYDGKVVVEALKDRLAEVDGIPTEVAAIAGGPASTKPVNLRLKGDDGDTLLAATEEVRQYFDDLPGLAQVEDTRPLPGIDWEVNIDVEEAGRYGTDVATVGGMVQLVTTGLLLDTMRIEGNDEEVEIRVRFPEEDRVLSTLDTLKVRTQQGLVPLSNFVTREPVPTLAQIDRIDQSRYFDVKAAVDPGLVKLSGPEGDRGVMPAAEADRIIARADTPEAFTKTPVTSTERINTITQWLDSGVLPTGVDYEWAGDFADQSESTAFLGKAFAGALFLMFIILLAQFNSFYNSVLVLLAVVLSSAGVLFGMLVMGQPFSVIMTGTGVVALAGIVVNNNIVLIDTYQEYAQYMPRLEAITRTAESRIRPVLLTTITTMAGLAPMMFGLSFDFINGGYSVNAPTALWWVQLATAVVFGLGIATILTLVFTPSMLALRVWVGAGAYRSVAGLKSLTLGRDSRAARDLALQKKARRTPVDEVQWDFEEPAIEADDGDDAPTADELDYLLTTRRSAGDGIDADTTDDDKPGPHIKAAE